MKRKGMCLFLVLACCLSLTAPAFAVDWSAGLPEEIKNLIGGLPSQEGSWTIKIDPDTGEASVVSPSNPQVVPSPQATVSTDTGTVDLKNFKKVNTYRSGMFADVADGDWFAQNVRVVYEYGLMNGNDGKFNPRNNITLAQALAITCRLHSTYKTGKADFAQSGKSWYQVYLDYAHKNGLSVPGEGGDLNVPAARRNVAKLLYQAMPDTFITKNTVPDGGIPDVPIGADGYREIYHLYRIGIAGGSGSDHAFKPGAAITRAEAAAMIARMVEPSLRLGFDIQNTSSNPKIHGTIRPVISPDGTISIITSPHEEPTGSTETSGVTQTPAVDSLWKGKTIGDTLPSFNDKATQEKVLALLDQYDPDGAFILRKAGLDFMTWFSFGNQTLLEGVDTAVHEEYHSVSHSASWDETVYYAGNGILFPVTETEVYNSKEMIPYIPSDLWNTSRFDTYINTDEANLSSVKSGIYGLMNEFNAYGCGLNNTVALYDFYKTNAKSVDDWFQYVILGANDRMAYAEFRYYMLTYMLYAKDKHPDVYQGILNNQEFKNTFRLVDDWFIGNVQKYEGTLSDLKQRLESAGHRVQIEGDWFQVDGAGISIFGGDYQKLMKAMDAEKHQAVLAALKG